MKPSDEALHVGRERIATNQNRVRDVEQLLTQRRKCLSTASSDPLYKEKATISVDTQEF